MMKLADTAKCTYCNVALSIKDVMDRECASDVIVNYCIGTCPQCGKVFSWEEVFDRIGIDELKEERLDV